jgi:hypothetical protein
MGYQSNMWFQSLRDTLLYTIFVLSISRPTEICLLLSVKGEPE